MEINGYTCKTTFWQDFSIADRFGKSAVIDTYNRAFKEWKNNIIYITELSLVLNWKIWQHYENNNTLDEVYNRLWRELDDWVFKNKTGDDIKYYIRTTD